jgi:general secretion pathway protein G
VVLAIVGVVGIGVIGMVAALLIPNFLDALQKAKQKRTMADLRNVSVALGSYASDEYSYPQPDELADKLAPKYMQTFPAADGWGRPFKYDCWGRVGDSQRCEGYVIASAGRDGVFTESSLRDYNAQPVSTTDYDADIVVMNGEFLRAPQAAGPR